MKALDFLRWQRDGVAPVCGFLMSIEDPGTLEHPKPCKPPSTSELRRWLRDRIVSVNLKRIGPDDIVQWPILELTYFVTSDRIRTAIVMDERLYSPVAMDALDPYY